MNSIFKRITAGAAAAAMATGLLSVNGFLFSTDSGLFTDSAVIVNAAGGYTIPDIKVTQKQIPDSEGLKMTRDMRLGWNLGNTLDSIDDTGTVKNDLDLETYWNGGFKTTKEMIDVVKKAGFNTVRVPVSWHNHMDGSLNINKAWMDRVQEVVDYAYKNDMYVILNVHHDNDPNTMYPTTAKYEQSKKYMTSVWKQVGERFKDYGDKLIFETMNEPRMTGHTYEWWLNMDDKDCIDAIQTINKLNQDCLDTIRATGGNNAKRFVSVPGYDCSIEGATNSYFKLPTDKVQNRLIVAVHAYTPYGFALAETSDSQSTDKFDYTKDAGEIDRVLNAIYDTYISKGIPVYIGEFGARDKGGNTQPRVDWAAYFVANASARNIPCCWWDDYSFMLLDRSDVTWKNPDIVKALNQYAMGAYDANLTTGNEEADGEILEGTVTYDSSKSLYNITLPAASNDIHINVEMGSAQGASGCIAEGFSASDGQYYWVMIPWTAKSSGDIKINIKNGVNSLAYSKNGEDLTTNDPDLIKQAIAELQKKKNFQAQVWWAGDAAGKEVDLSNVKITGAYVKSAGASANPTTAPTVEPTTEPTVEPTVEPTTEPTTEPTVEPTVEPTKEPEAVKGDVNNDGSVTTADYLALMNALIGKTELSAEEKANADMNDDSKISIIDLILLRNKFA